MQHLEEGTIHAWLDGQLPADEAARLEEHVASCTECAAKVAEARGLVAASSRIVSALDVTPGGVIPIASRRPRRFRITPMITALAATVVLAAGVLFVQKQRQITLGEDSPALAHLDSSAMPAPMVGAPKAADTLAPRTTLMAPATIKEPVVKIGPRPEPRMAQAKRVDAPSPGVPSAPSVPAASQTQIAANAVAEARADSLRLDKSRPMTATGTAAAAIGGFARTAVGGTAGRAPAVAPMMPDRKIAVEDRNAVLMTGCYETNESTDVLPRRFALADAGQVQYVDSTGKKDGIIRDVVWVPRPDGALIRAGTGDLFTIRQLSNELVVESPKVVRTVRAIPCR